MPFTLIEGTFHIIGQTAAAIRAGSARPGPGGIETSPTPTRGDSLPAPEPSSVVSDLVNPIRLER